MKIYEAIVHSKAIGQKLLALLIDPDKIKLENLLDLIKKIHQSPATHIFIGGSSIENNILDEMLVVLKQNISLPLILFPGDFAQISGHADAILFMSLLSGRNPEYLIGQQIQAVPLLQKTKLQIIPTGYILIESGTKTAVERVSQTSPMNRNCISKVVQTAIAGQYMGKKLIYLEAGSGANLRVQDDLIQQVSQNISIPLIVGGGIRSLEEIEKVFMAGADVVVIGTAFEKDNKFFTKKKSYI